MKHAHSGSVLFIQRFDSALRLNVHAHLLQLDGVYVRDSDGALDFYELPELRALWRADEVAGGGDEARGDREVLREVGLADVGGEVPVKARRRRGSGPVEQLRFGFG